MTHGDAGQGPCELPRVLSRFKMNFTTSPTSPCGERENKRRGHAGPQPPSPTPRCCGSQFCSRCRMFFPVVLPFLREADEQTSQLGGHLTIWPGRPDLGVAAVQSGLGKPPSQCLETIKPQGSCISLCVWGRVMKWGQWSRWKLIWGVPPFLASGELAQCPCHSDLALRVLSDVCSQGSGPVMSLMIH